MRKNFNAIAALGPNEYHLKCAILLAEGETLLSFEKGFPHLFEDGDDSGALCVPLSLLKQAAYERLRNDEGYSEITARKIAEFNLESGNLAIPVAFRWGEDTGEDAPEGILDQLIDQRAGAGMKVEYRDRTYIVLSVVFEGRDPQVGAVFRKKPRVRYLSVADTAFIDLNT